MDSCIRCRDSRLTPDANYCGNCGFPVFDALDEDTVREQARQEQTGFLDGFDMETILAVMEGDQQPPAEPYQWYLEEGVKKALTDLALLQRWEWFDAGPISALFLTAEFFEDNPPEDAINQMMLWGRVFALFYEAFQPAGLEYSIRIGASFAEGLHPVDDIDVSITVDPDDDSASGVTGPAS